VSDEKDPSTGSKKSVIGEHSDKALADIVKGLLLKPAETTGDLISDTIGILGDRIKSKRQINAQLGLEEVRKKLETNNSDIKDITPPAEEELHLLVNGLSLAGDDIIRDLWAGFFAKAIEPKSSYQAERPFIRILENLSKTDAVIIDFLAYAYDSNSKIQHEVEEFRKEISRSDGKYEDHLDDLLKLRQKSADKFIQVLESKISENNLDQIDNEHWDDNLVRLGLIERVSKHSFPKSNISIRSGSAHEVNSAFSQMIRTIEGIKSEAI